MVSFEHEWEKLNEYEMRKIGEFDELHSNYRGLGIYLSIPNGGILGVSIVEETLKQGYYLYTEVLGLDVYEDEDWHIDQAQTQIDHLWKERLESQGQLSLNLGI